MYQTAFTVAYFGMLKVGEIGAGCRTIKAKDVHVGKNKNKILMVLYTSKTHGKESCPQKIRIMADNQTHVQKNKFCFCPFNLACRYCSWHGNYLEDSEPFLVLRDQTAVRPDQLRKVLQTMLSRLNLQAYLYDMHSFRSGRSGDMLKYRYSISRIHTMGRWQSNIVFKYIRN